MKTIVLSLVIVVSLSLCLNSQPLCREESLRVFNNKYAIENLSAGVASDNLGLKKESIYFVGLYKVNQVYDNLAKILCEPQNESVLKLTILAMYRIDNYRTVKMLKDFFRHCDNLKIKTLCMQVQNDFDSFSK